MLSLSDIELRITEIFVSLQGETDTAGLVTTFIRLTGCPLRCQYCDTAYAFSGGKKQTIQSIVDEVSGFGTNYVTVTGGEPLSQPNVHFLLSALCDLGLVVSLETSGALDISNVDSRVVKILDVKTPGSGEVARNRYQNLSVLQVSDQVKFVICNKNDYSWAMMKCEELKLYDLGCELLFSPSSDELESRELADWIVEDRLPVRMQIQLHKLLWNDEAGS